MDEKNPSYCSIDGIVYSKDKTRIFVYPSGRKDTSFEVPSFVNTIYDAAFACNANIESVTIPDSVTTIGDSAFYYCVSLKSIVIPNTITTIGEQAFVYCRSLTSITLPSSLTSISDYAFSQCNSLESIVFEGTIEQWKTIAKDNVCSLSKNVTIHCSNGDITK